MKTALVATAILGAAVTAIAYQPPRVSPGDGAMGVPLNVRFIVTTQSGEKPIATMTGPDDAGVWVRTESLGPGSYWVTPLDPLQPLTTYRLEVRENFDPTVVTVTTGLDVDEAPPQPPVVASASWNQVTHGFMPCDQAATVTFHLERGVSEPILATQVFAARREAEIDVNNPTFVTTEAAPVIFDGCSAVDYPLREHHEVSVRLRSVDWAGNVSEPSEVQRVSSTGCTSVAGAPVALLALAVLRRRPR